MLISRPAFLVPFSPYPTAPFWGRVPCKLGHYGVISNTVMCVFVCPDRCLIYAKTLRANLYHEAPIEPYRTVAGTLTVPTVPLGIA